MTTENKHTEGCSTTARNGITPLDVGLVQWGVQVATDAVASLDPRPDADGESGEPSVSLDDTYHVLSNERRRSLVKHLSGGVTRKADLSEEIAGEECGGVVGHQDRKRVYVALHQVHIPRLEEMGLVEVSESGGRITPTDRLHEVNRIRETVARQTGGSDE